MRFGANVSIARGILGAISQAEKTGCQCFQIFSRNPRGRGERKISKEEIKQFKLNLKKAHFLGHFNLHSPYYLNLASPDEKKWQYFISVLVKDLKKCEILGSKFLVLHVGHHMGKGIDWGIKRVVQAIKKAFRKSKSKTFLLLENMAGQGTEMGFRFQQLAKIIQLSAISNGRLAICFDTCHAFAAGYDLRNKKALDRTLKEFDKIIGLKYLKLLHGNDSKKDLGSRIDRHEHIGHGKIGIEGFQALVNHPKLKHLDLIIETPHFGKVNWDRKNLKILRSLIRQ